MGRNLSQDVAKQTSNQGVAPAGDTNANGDPEQYVKMKFRDEEETAEDSRSTSISDQISAKLAEAAQDAQNWLKSLSPNSPNPAGFAPKELNSVAGDPLEWISAAIPGGFSPQLLGVNDILDEQRRIQLNSQDTPGHELGWPRPFNAPAPYSDFQNIEEPFPAAAAPAAQLLSPGEPVYDNLYVGEWSYDYAGDDYRRQRHPMYRYLQAAAVATATNSSCGWTGMALVGRYAATLNGLSDALACQTQCQLHSDPEYVSNCTSPFVELPSTTLCVGANFSPADGRCALVADVKAVVPSNDMVALPVLCNSQKNFATVTAKQSLIQSNVTARECLGEHGITATLATVAKMPLTSWGSSTFDYHQDLRSELKMILKSYSDLPIISTKGLNLIDINQAADESISESTSSSGEAESSSAEASLHQRRLSVDSMPRITSDMVNVTMNLFYQTSNVLIPPESTVMSVPMIWPRGVDDWRQCALLCDLISKVCKAWTFLYLENEAEGGCYLASTSDYPTVLNSDGHYRSVAGLAYTRLPSYLFGEQQQSDINAFPGADENLTTDSAVAPVISLHPECHSRTYDGFLFMTSTDQQATILSSNLYSLAAVDLKTCGSACSGTSGCVAYQFVSAALSQTSPQLKELVELMNGSCVLFSGLGSSPILHPVEPLLGCGFVSCGDDTTDTVREPIAQWVTASDKRIPGTVATINISYIRAQTHVCTSSAPWSLGWSIKGNLLSTQANLIPEVHTAMECDDYCRNVQLCEGWTFGAWQTCYLFETIDSYVEDSDCTSGQLKCARSLSETVGTDSTESQVSDKDGLRSIETCARARKNAYYKSGTEIRHKDVESASECFRLCRTSAGCNYISWLPSNSLLSSGTVLNNARCVLYSDVQDADVPMPTDQGMVVSEMICDAIGSAQSKTQPTGHRTAKPGTLAWVAVGGAGGIALVVGSVFTYFRLNNDKFPNDGEEMIREDARTMSSKFILDSDSRRNQLSDRLSFQSDIVCEVNDKPLVMPTNNRASLVRFADEVISPAPRPSSHIDPGTCITMRTEDSANSPDAGLEDILACDVNNFHRTEEQAPLTIKNVRNRNH